MLKRLYIDNIRSFQNFELKPERVCALVGPNGGGKTTIFEVLKALQGFLSPSGMAARELFGSSSLTRWDTRLGQVLEIDIQGEGAASFAYRLEVKHDLEKRDAFVEERLSSDGQDLYRLVNGEVQLFADQPSGNQPTTFPVDPRRSFLPILDPRPHNKRITAFKRWIADMWLFKLQPNLITSTTTGEANYLSHDGGNFVSWYRTLQQESPGIPESLRPDLLSVIPGLVRIRLARLGSEEKVLTFDCATGGKEYSLRLDELSDGQRVLLVLYTVMHAFGKRAALLLFDEPDNFVAEKEIQPWLSAVRERLVEANRGTLMVISHHAEVINYLAPDQLVQVWRDDGPSRQQMLEIDRDTGLSASTLLRMVPLGAK